MRKRRRFCLYLVIVVVALFVLRDVILTIYPAMFIKKLLTERDVQNRWKFSLPPQSLDGTDGILQSKLLGKPLWDVLLYDELEAAAPVACGTNMLVIMVHSATANTQKRNLLRKYYKIYQDLGIFQKLGKVKVLFIIGKDLRPEINDEVSQEAKEHQDIIRGNFVDHYFNMTIKNIFGKVKINALCKFKYLLKADDDVFLNFPVILLNLNKLKENNSRLYLGWPCKGGLFSYPHVFKGRVFQQRLENFNFTLPDYPFPLAPSYGYGFTYILSESSVDALVTEYKYIPYIRIIDDFYVAYVLSRLGIICCETPEFVFEMTEQRRNEPCYLSDVLTWNFHIETQNDLVQLENVYMESVRSWTSCINSYTNLLNNYC